MNRVEAIQALESKGLFAKERAGWALGDSIFVGALPFEHRGIKGYEVALHLYPDPSDEDVWWITDFAVPGRDIKCGALSDAVDVGAERVLAEVHRIEAAET